MVGIFISFWITRRRRGFDALLKLLNVKTRLRFSFDVESPDDDVDLTPCMCSELKLLGKCQDKNKIFIWCWITRRRREEQQSKRLPTRWPWTSWTRSNTPEQINVITYLDQTHLIKYIVITYLDQTFLNK
jgi:hypothetical protein